MDLYHFFVLVENGFKALAPPLSTAASAVKLQEWIKARRLPPAAEEAVKALPAHSSVDEAVSAVLPALRGVGGPVFLHAGNDGGGDLRAEGAHVFGGDGPAGGGAVVVKAGDGGQHKGGDVVTRRSRSRCKRQRAGRPALVVEPGALVPS